MASEESIRFYRRRGDRSAHAMKTAQMIVSPTATEEGTSDSGIDTKTANLVIGHGGNSDIGEPFKQVHT
jgi:hypothetical protein